MEMFKGRRVRKADVKTFPCFSFLVFCAKDVFRTVCCGENLLELANKQMRNDHLVSCFGFQVTSMSVVSVL